MEINVSPNHITHRPIKIFVKISKSKLFRNFLKGFRGQRRSIFWTLSIITIFLGILFPSIVFALDIPPNTWVKRTSSYYPSAIGSSGAAANKHVKMIYNSNDHRIYMIGGDYAGPATPDDNSHEMVYSYDVATDTWVNVLNFTNSGTSGYPEGRCNPGWAYDPTRNVIWFGMGQRRQSSPRSGLLEGGLWTYDPTVAQNSGEVWHREGPGVPNQYNTGSPRLPANTSQDVWYMLYDPVTDALYAPYNNGSGKYMAKYSLSGITIKNGASKDNWSYTTLSTPDYFLGMDSFCYDSKRSRFVFYFPWPSGTNRGETWSFVPSTNKWTLLSSTVLPNKSQFGMVYDSNADRIVLLGGQDCHEGQSGCEYVSSGQYMGMYVFNPNTNVWSLLSVSGDIPDGRKGENSVYDPYNNVIVQMGGRGWDSTPDTYGFNGNEIFLLRLNLGSPPPDTTPPSAPTNLRIN